MMLTPKTLVRILLCCAGFGLFADSVAARLTEKEVELIKRFGRVESRGEMHRSIQGRIYVVGTELTFRSEQWTITTLLIDDRCAQITPSSPFPFSLFTLLPSLFTCLLCRAIAS